MCIERWLPRGAGCAAAAALRSLLLRTIPDICAAAMILMNSWWIPQAEVSVVIPLVVMEQLTSSLAALLKRNPFIRSVGRSIRPHRIMMAASTSLLLARRSLGSVVTNIPLRMSTTARRLAPTSWRCST